MASLAAPRQGCMAAARTCRGKADRRRGAHFYACEIRRAEPRIVFSSSFLRIPMLARFTGLLVHCFTASGAAFGLAALLAAADGRFPAMFAWLGAAFMVDAVDGTLARRFKVAELVRISTALSSTLSSISLPMSSCRSSLCGVRACSSRRSQSSCVAWCARLRPSISPTGG